MIIMNQMFEVHKMSKQKKQTPETQSAPAVTEKTEFVPSPKWKRVLAWVLFVIVILGIICWLLGIAVPDWTEKVLDYFRN